MTAADENVRPDSHARDERTDRYAEAILAADMGTATGAGYEEIARAVMAVADAEREQDAATIAELRAEVERLRELLRIGIELDNHHNAAVCPYCSPGRVRALAPSTSPAEQEGGRG